VRGLSLVAALSIGLAPPLGVEARCGTERWPVKTGTDGDAAKVDRSAATPTTIERMRAWKPPAALPPAKRIAPYETVEWTVDATLVRYKFENDPVSGDSDYRLVLADPAGATISAVIPMPACVGAQSPFLEGIRAARAAFDQKFTATGQFQDANTPVRVAGVGFFDVGQGKSGTAADPIELHPVVSLRFDPPGFSP
jgi:hypothetical protein